jgi:uncharacterized protein DUF481
LKRAVFTYLLIFLFSINGAKAQKSDTVTLYNGDRITCEVKSLSKGKLYVKTSDMSKLYIKWTKVAHIETIEKFEITLTDHSSYLGKFSKRSEGVALMSFGVFQENIPLIEITNLVQINSSFWKQLNGSFDAGYSYTHGNQNLQFNSTGEIKHRTKKFLNKINYDAVISDNSNVISRRQNGGYTFQVFHNNSFFTIYNVSWQQNTELGIEDRILTNARLGYTPIDNSANLLDISAGLLLNREFTSEQSATNNTEAVLNITYDFFVFTKPNIDLTTSIIAYPSFTIKDRFRSDYDFRVRWEVFNNFTLNLKYYFTYDSKPPSVDALQFDYGINTSVGYSF